MAGSRKARRSPGTRHLARITLGAALLSAIASAPQAASPSTAAAQVGTCPAFSSLAPAGPGTTRFTMMIRINQQVNVNTWTNFDSATGGLGGRVRQQDIFVINTRYETTTPSVAETLANNLRATFPCNRIVALNGMGLDPNLPGYAFSLASNSGVSAIFTDFEPMDWNDAPRPPWSFVYRKVLKRIKGFTGTVTNALAANPLGAGKLTGLAPIENSTWNFGEIAQVLDKRNTRLGLKLGPQSVQTQDYCANGGPTAFAQRVKSLRDQYKYRTIIRKVKKRLPNGKVKKKKIKIRRKIKPAGRPNLSNLAVQISFSDTPNPNAGMAITKTAPGTAAACAAAGLKQGGGAFFFFASDDSMRLLFQQPQIAFLRPSVTSAKPR
jgi:hypothetical protein